MTASKNENRHRLYSVATTLRQFGLTDGFGIGDHVLSAQKVSKRTVESLLKNGPPLPRGVTTSFVADCLIAAIAAADAAESPATDRTLNNVETKLAAIAPGNPGASKFHNFILKVLPAIFDKHLGNVEKEKPLDQGLKKLDIKVDNDKAEGFFCNLRTQRSLFCPYIFCECKNYSEDPANPEFDQLLNRLNDKTTRFGLLICRKITDHGKVLQRCRNAFSNERKIVIVLDDKDLISLAEFRRDNEFQKIDEYLQKKLEAVML